MSKVSKVPVKKVQWGFDLSGFSNKAQLESFMAKHRIQRSGTKTITIKGKPKGSFKDYERKYTYQLWRGQGIALTTGHSGREADREGFLGYVGVEIEPRAMKKFRAFRNEFVKTASVKDESKRRSDFISVPSEMRKKPRTEFI